MLCTCKCHWIVLYTVHFTAFCLGGPLFFPRTRCTMSKSQTCNVLDSVYQYVAKLGFASKVIPRYHWARGSAPISVSLALSQTPAEATRSRILSCCIAWYARLLPSYLWYSLTGENVCNVSVLVHTPHCLPLNYRPIFPRRTQQNSELKPKANICTSLELPCDRWTDRQTDGRVQHLTRPPSGLPQNNSIVEWL